jgi:DNA-binding NtrC family response regulator
VVLAGPDAGRHFDAHEGTVLIGTHPDCQLQLSDTLVSRRHCALELGSQRVKVRDLGSKNGTKYLGARLTSLEVPLGGSIELGETTLGVLPRLAEGALSIQHAFGALLGRSTSMRRLFAKLEQVAPTDATVLLRGETGTGKETVARALHAASPRAAGPFVVLDCGSTSTALVQPMLFGHVRGSFTGAVKDATGLIEAANGGVLFLDEVASLSTEVQPMLLRVLESRTYQRVGEGKSRSSDFRLLATTTEDLGALASRGVFRSDLFYRLSAIALDLPPLRERLEDVPLLARAFAQRLKPGAKLSPTALAALSAWRWPGNVRELRNAVERLLTLGEESLHQTRTGEPEDFHAARVKALAAFEKSYLEALLDKHDGSATAAAREAGIARSYLYKLLETHALDPGRFRR